MTLSERVFQYCERGTNEALWAEPLNAVSNGGFILAALIFWQLMLWRPREQRNADHYLLMTLVFLIGFGSLAFHVYANRITELADVIPIGLFMLVYLGFALNRFVGVPPGWTVLFVIAFAALMSLAVQVKCWDGGVGLMAGPEEARPCMNGSVGYLPALGALIIVGMILAERRHRAAPYVLAAAVTFIVSIILRSLDFALCDLVVIEGRDVGTHFMWHLLNAVVLFLLLRASLETGTKPAAAEAAPAAVPAETEQAASADEAASEDTGTEAAAEEAETSDKPEEDGKPEEKAEIDETESDEVEKKLEAEEEESAAPPEATPEGQDEPDVKDEPEGETASPRETGSKPDEAKEEAVKATSEEAVSETSEPETPESKTTEPEPASPEDTSEEGGTAKEDDAAASDKSTTEEDVAKAVKALSIESGEGAEKPTPRKRSARRRKPSSSD